MLVLYVPHQPVHQAYMLSVREIEKLHLRVNFNREGLDLKTPKRKVLQFKKCFRQDVKNLGGGREAAQRAFDILTEMYDNTGVYSPHILSVQYPYAQLLISGAKKMELRKGPPTAPYVQGTGVRLLLSQSSTKKKKAFPFFPHSSAEYGPRQDGRLLGQVTIGSFMEILEEDLTEQVAHDAQVTLDSLKAAWEHGYKWGWILECPLAFTHAPVTYDHAATEGTRMGTIFTCSTRAPIKRALRI